LRSAQFLRSATVKRSRKGFALMIFSRLVRPVASAVAITWAASAFSLADQIATAPPPPAKRGRPGMPRVYDEDGVQRYGFHGISYEFIAEQLRAIDPDLARGRVVVAHLGNGASLCAMRDGRSVDTTMGFTALDGLLMGTGAGTLDPGAVT